MGGMKAVVNMDNGHNDDIAGQSQDVQDKEDNKECELVFLKIG